MPTVPRRPAAQRERERLQARRLRAAELFATGVHQAEVARQLGVPPRRSVSDTPTGRGASRRCITKGRAARRHGCRMPSSPKSNAKRALNFSIYGRARPVGTALSTAVPGGLLTRKRTEVRLLPRPQHPLSWAFIACSTR
jgi:hypothetical protein